MWYHKNYLFGNVKEKNQNAKLCIQYIYNYIYYAHKHTYVNKEKTGRKYAEVFSSGYFLGQWNYEW